MYAYALLIAYVGVGNVNVSEEALKKAFESYGPIESVKRVESKSCAFVNFYHLDHAILARKAMNNSRLGGMVIKTGFAKVLLLNLSNLVSSD